MDGLFFDQWNERHKRGGVRNIKKEVRQMAKGEVPAGQRISVNSRAWKVWNQELANFAHTYWCVVHKVGLPENCSKRKREREKSKVDRCSTSTITNRHSSAPNAPMIFGPFWELNLN